MKKLKRIAAFTLALAMVVSVCLIHASAVDYSGTDDGYNNEKGYHWNNYLTIRGNTVTASITVSTNERTSSPIMLTGVVPTFLSARLEGTYSYTYADGSGKFVRPFHDDTYGDLVSSVTARYEHTEDKEFTVVGATCDYWVMGGKEAVSTIPLGINFCVN